MKRDIMRDSRKSVAIQVRVPFSDVDSSQRIHFTAMLRYMEIADHELMRRLGFPYATAFPEISFPRVRVACDYRRAICYDDELIVEAHIEHVGHSSWRVGFAAYLNQQYPPETRSAPDTSAARGEMTIVALDLATQKARPLPDELRAALISSGAEGKTEPH